MPLKLIKIYCAYYLYPVYVTQYPTLKMKALIFKTMCAKFYI